MLVISRRPSSGHILEALHIDPASGVSPDNDKSTKVSKPAVSASSGLAKLAKASTTGGPLKQQQGEKKETPQERLKRIMSKQLNKQIKKDTATEMAKKREQERHRQEKLAETNQLSRYRHRSHSRSRSPPRRHRSSRSPSRSSRRYHSRSRSPSRSRTRTRSRSHSYSRSPRVRSRSRYWCIFCKAGCWHQDLLYVYVYSAMFFHIVVVSSGALLRLLFCNMQWFSRQRWKNESDPFL